MSANKKSKFWSIFGIIILVFLIVKCAGAGTSSSGSSSASSYSYSSSVKSPYASSSGDSKVVSRAKSYLRSSSFSKKGLIEQLEYEGFSNAQATEAVNSISVDWNEQAVQKAKSYLKNMAFSYDGLVEQLIFEGFTSSQAKYGADNSGYGLSSAKSSSSIGASSASGNKAQALKMAQSYLKSSNFSRSGLVEQLMFEGFSNDEASYAASNCGANWNEQAAKCAASYLRLMKMSSSDLREQLKYEGFTSSQIDYALSNYYKY